MASNDMFSDQQREFLASRDSAAVITVGADGVPKPVRITLGFFEGVLTSSGTESRVRTKRFRQDPTCVLYFAHGRFQYLSVESTVEIIDGAAGVELNQRLIADMQGVDEGDAVDWFGETLEPDAFRQRLIDDGRLVYRFHPTKVHGILRWG